MGNYWIALCETEIPPRFVTTHWVLLGGMSYKPLKIKTAGMQAPPQDLSRKSCWLSILFPAFRTDLISPRVDYMTFNLFLSFSEKKCKMNAELNIKGILPGGQDGLLCPLPQATWKTVKWEELSLGDWISVSWGSLFSLSPVLRQNSPEAQIYFTALSSELKGKTFLQNCCY